MSMSKSINPGAFNRGAADKWATARRPSSLVPPDLRLLALRVPVSEQDGAYRTTLDLASLVPVGTTVYYVDPVGGSDGNSGTSRAAPLKYLSTALGKGDVDQIRIINLTADFVGRGTGNAGNGQPGWNNRQPNRSLSVIVEGPWRYISASSASVAPPVFAAVPGYPHVYQTAGVGNGVIDCSLQLPVAFAAGAKAPAWAGRIIANAPRRYAVHKKLGSIAEVEATPGGWYADATTTYVRPFDDRDLTVPADAAAMVVSTNVNSGRWSPTTNDLSLYVEGMDFVGGSRSFYLFSASSVTGCTILFNRCSAQGAGGANGFNIQGNVTAYSHRCAAYDNWADGFNYHSYESDGAALGTAPRFVEIECVAAGNGSTGSTGTSDNASTAHEDCIGIRLGCVYPDSNDRVVTDTNYATTWNLGCVAGQAMVQASGKETYASLMNATMYLDGCLALRGTGQGNADYLADVATSSLFWRNMAGVTNVGGKAGLVAQY